MFKYKVGKAGDMFKMKVSKPGETPAFAKVTGFDKAAKDMNGSEVNSWVNKGVPARKAISMVNIRKK